MEHKISVQQIVNAGTRVGPANFLTLARLAARANHRGIVRVSVNRLAREWRVPQSTLWLSLATLTKAGEIARKRDGKSGSEITLTGTFSTTQPAHENAVGRVNDLIAGGDSGRDLDAEDGRAQIADQFVGDFDSHVSVHKGRSHRRKRVGDVGIGQRPLARETGKGGAERAGKGQGLEHTDESRPASIEPPPEWRIEPSDYPGITADGKDSTGVFASEEVETIRKAFGAERGGVFPVRRAIIAALHSLAAGSLGGNRLTPEEACMYLTGRARMYRAFIERTKIIPDRAVVWFSTSAYRLPIPCDAKDDARALAPAPRMIGGAA